MDNREHIQNIRRWKNEGCLGEQRSSIVSSIQANRNSLQCEKIGYALKNTALEDWKAMGEQPLKLLRVALLSGFTSNAYPHILRSLLLSEGMWPEVYTAGYNQYVYELMMPKSGLYEFAPQLTLCLLDEHTVLDEMSRDWDVRELELACERKLDQLKQLVSTFQQHGTGILVFNTIPMSTDMYNTKIDYKTKAQLSRTWRSFNIELLNLSAEWSLVVTLDTEVLMQENKVGSLRDPRLMYNGSFHFSQELLFAFALESVKIARSLLGLNKKCLVLDLDNTLWGGIVGDDGVNGVQLGDTITGNIFVDFQKALKQLKNQGVLLSISSKNEEKVVREMFEQHPHMQLTLDDVVMLCANWDPKHDNIRAIAEALNIGIDSLVFIDDNPFERSLIRQSLPEVVVPELRQDPSYYREDVLSSGWFNTIKLTTTDVERTDQYRTEVERKQLKQVSGSIEDYLRQLDIRVNLLSANDFHLPRLAQLITRTNQFNMTTRRYQESELRELEISDKYWIFGFQSQDRFGDYGMIGAVIVEMSARTWRIDNFLMSCRVFSRDIETAVLRHVLWKAKEVGVQEVHAEYIPTAKNVIVRDFYAEHGFELALSDTDEHAHKVGQLYVHRLERMPNQVEWIQMMTGEGTKSL